ncbi:uncharacterized protein LOC122947568 [Acropora millepora]|uniref:uncharacterized protein LOC122947568 n=1 Tax=Acropora millepora TaxID=45264 RepID=UPI001CF39A10|nr:uncharacterized protein LOC122947568 [Acropora millepora]
MRSCPLSTVYRRHCLVLGMIVVVVVNLVLLWRVMFWNKETSPALEATFIRSATKTSHLDVVSDHSNLRLRDEKLEDNILESTSRTLLGNLSDILKTSSTKHGVKGTQWLPTEEVKLRVRADHDHVHWKDNHWSLQDYIKVRKI